MIFGKSITEATAAVRVISRLGLRNCLFHITQPCLEKPFLQLKANSNGNKNLKGFVEESSVNIYVVGNLLGGLSG